MTRIESSLELIPAEINLRVKRARRVKRVSLLTTSIIAAYIMLAYVIVPAGYEHRHPAIDTAAGISTTADGHPGDPLNVALIGSEADLKKTMLAAGWFVADSLGFKSDLKITADTVLERSDNKAPVSNLFLWGRKEDLAFEQPVGDDPRQRHHVRFWKSRDLDEQSRPSWMGAATYDKRVGFSHTTGQITHHIAADVDAERDHLFTNLEQTGYLPNVQVIDDFHKVRAGQNGGGDPWHTDGRLFTGTIVIPSDKGNRTPRPL